MASIYRETVVDVGADRAWAALRTVAAPHELFAPVLTDGELNGETRRVQFANGMVLNERIIDIDDLKHPGSHGDGLSAKSVGIPRAVELLVMVSNNRKHEAK